MGGGTGYTANGTDSDTLTLMAHGQVGKYILVVQVDDGFGVESDDTKIEFSDTCTSGAGFIDAGPHLWTSGSRPVTVQALVTGTSGKVDWSFVDKPLASALQNSDLTVDYGNNSATFTPDKAGTYELEATIGTGAAALSDTVEITVTRLWARATAPAGRSVIVQDGDGAIVALGKGEEKSAPLTASIYDKTSGTWLLLGDQTPLVVDGNLLYDLTTAPDGTLYAAFADMGERGGDRLGNFPVSVAHYHGGSWEVMPAVGGTPVGLAAFRREGLSLKVAADGTPYVAVREYRRDTAGTEDVTIRIMKFNGADWKKLAEESFAADTIWSQFELLGIRDDKAVFVERHKEPGSEYRVSLIKRTWTDTEAGTATTPFKTIRGDLPADRGSYLPSLLRDDTDQHYAGAGGILTAKVQCNQGTGETKISVGLEDIDSHGYGTPIQTTRSDRGCVYPDDLQNDNQTPYLPSMTMVRGVDGTPVFYIGNASRDSWFWELDYWNPSANMYSVWYSQAGQPDLPGVMKSYAEGPRLVQTGSGMPLIVYRDAAGEQFVLYMVYAD